MKKEQDQQLLRLQQLAQRADRLDAPAAGRFVVGEERAMAVHEARAAGLCASFCGGWESAERVQVCMHPPGAEPVFTAVWVRIGWNAKFCRMDHRSLLGSLLALGIDRSFFGDLIVQEDCAYLLALPEAARRLPMEWTGAGRDTITVTEVEAAPAIAPPRGQEMRDTVASMRLDSVLASGMKLSRAKAADMIRAGLVQVDHMPQEHTDYLLEVGSLISVRGFGRIRVCEVGTPTRKDRLPVTLEIFHQ